MRELRPRKPGDPAALEEENVAEAVANAHRVWATPAMREWRNLEGLLVKNGRF